MLGSCTLSVGADRGRVNIVRADVSDLHLSLLRPRGLMKLNDRASVHSDFDMIALPSILAHSSDAPNSSSSDGGTLSIRVSVSQVNVEWRVEWHLALVALIEKCFDVSVRTKQSSPISKPPSMHSVTELKSALKQPSTSLLRLVEIELENVQATAVLSPSSALTAGVHLALISIETGARKGKSVHISAQSVAIDMNDLRIGLIKDLDVANVAKSSEVTRYLAAFSDSTSYCYAPIEGGSKVFWCVVNHRLDAMLHIDSCVDV